MLRLRVVLTGMAVAVALLGAKAQAQGPKGALVIAGGDLRYDNPAWKEFVQLARGKPVVVFPTASSRPRRNGTQAVEHLKSLGADAELLPVALKDFNVKPEDAVKDRDLIEKVRKAGGIWFIGGDQGRITGVLHANGQDTPLLAAVRQAYRDGTVIGGTSAGAAIMSKWMFKDARDSLDTMRYGIRKGTEVDVGLGFVGDDWFVDQHFIQRGRFARSLVAMRDFDYRHGIGIDENTALVVTGGTVARVVGYHGAVVMDLSQARSDRKASPFSLTGARLSYLADGDAIDLTTRKVTPSAQKRSEPKIDPKARDFVPSFNGVTSFVLPDALSPNSVYLGLTRALDGKQPAVEGLAFRQIPQGERNDEGFKIRFYRGDDTHGWYTSKGGFENYTVLNVYVDITPVKVAVPVATPLK